VILVTHGHVEAMALADRIGDIHDQHIQH